MTGPSPPSTVTQLRCPKCSQFVYNNDADQFRGILKCERKSCGAHWWATILDAGDVREQLRRDFEGDDAMVKLLMARFDLPTHLTTSVYWQVLLTGSQAHHYYRDKATQGIRGRTMALIRRVLSSI